MIFPPPAEKVDPHDIRTKSRWRGEVKSSVLIPIEELVKKKTDTALSAVDKILAEIKRQQQSGKITNVDWTPPADIRDRITKHFQHDWFNSVYSFDPVTKKHIINDAALKSWTGKQHRNISDILREKRELLAQVYGQSANIILRDESQAPSRRGIVSRKSRSRSPPAPAPEETAAETPEPQFARPIQRKKKRQPTKKRRLNPKPLPALPHEDEDEAPAAPAGVQVDAAQVDAVEAAAAAEEKADENLLVNVERNIEVANDEEEAENERIFHQYRGIIGQHRIGKQHRFELHSERLHKASYGNIAAVHLLQTDGTMQPVMGAVHMVRPQGNYHADHFMVDVEGDINEGQRTIVERARRGPFRTKTGRSTILDRSAHVVYRKRAGAFEIVRRGVLNSEVQQLISKLSMHRVHQRGSHVVLIKGGRLGLLRGLGMFHLKKMILDCVDTYGNCGIEIVESRSGDGPLYKDTMHSAGYKARARKRKGAVHKQHNRRRVEYHSDSE